MTRYIYSTASTDVAYVEYEAGSLADKNRTPVIKRRVIVKGGARVPNKVLVTPQGVVTKISDEDAEMLERNETFQRHAKAGFVKISRTRADPDVVARDMTRKDGCTPKTAADFVKPPAVGVIAV